MQKRTLLLFSLLSLLIPLATMNIMTVNASISTKNWIGQTYEGSDSFLETSVTAYRTGSTAKILVQVYNDFYVGSPYFGIRPVNVSAVKVWLDWNIYYTSTECSQDNPLVVQPYQYRTFTITFTVPATTNASNLFAHNYRIDVEHVHTTWAGPKNIVGTWTYSGTGFAVYSAEQADSMQIYQKYSGIPKPTFTSPEAQILWTRALVESSIGARSYGIGNFTDAKIHYQTMDSSIQQAFQTEATKGGAYTDSQTYSNNITANATMMQSYGYILLGLGLTLFGVGTVIFVMRKKSS